MIVIEFINERIIGFNANWEWQFRKPIPLTRDTQCVWNGVLMSNLGVGVLPSFLFDKATRVVDTETWGMLKNTTDIKEITEDMKSEYLFYIMAFPDNVIKMADLRHIVPAYEYRE